MAILSDLLFIPGLLCTEALWRAQLEGLQDLAEIQVTTAQAEFDDIREIAEAILAAAPVRFALAGLSFGGYVALEVMRQAPERVDRLALIDTSARPDDSDTNRRRRDLLELAQKGRFLGVTDQLLKLFIHPSRYQDEALVAEVKGMAQAVGREGFLRQQRAIMGRYDSRPTLSQITCPTLVLVGRQDPLTPVEMHEGMHREIPNARLVVIEDCGHLSTMERAAEVTEAMRAWLQAG